LVDLVERHRRAPLYYDKRVLAQDRPMCHGEKRGQARRGTSFGPASSSETNAILDFQNLLKFMIESQQGVWLDARDELPIEIPLNRNPEVRPHLWPLDQGIKI
jgi:hypothetical protein